MYKALGFLWNKQTPVELTRKKVEGVVVRSLMTRGWSPVRC